MEVILDMCLGAVIDPLIWFMSMSTLGLKKTRWKYIGALIGYDILLLAKVLEQTYIGSGILDILVSLCLAGYIVAVCIKMFEGKIYNKVIRAGILFFILFVSEVITFELYLVLFHADWNCIMHHGSVNLICSYASRFLQGLSCYCLFRKKTLKRMLPYSQKIVALITGLGIVGTDLMAKGIQNKENEEVILLFRIIELLFMCYVGISLFMLRRKDKSILDWENKVKKNRIQQEREVDIRHFKHDFSTHIFMLKNLYCCKEYKRLERYMDNVFGRAEKVELNYEHKNTAIRIVISSLMQIAKRSGVALSVNIDVEEFGMNSNEICIILKKLVVDGLEHTTRVLNPSAKVSLRVFYKGDGYDIQCISSCVETIKGSVGKNEYAKEYYKDIFPIIEKYHGTFDRRVIMENGNDVVAVVIHI